MEAMNVELKALLDVIFSLIKVGEDIAEKDYSRLVPDLIALVGVAPNALINIGKLQEELNDLKGSAQEADLIAYIESDFASILDPEQEAKDIMHIALKTVSDVLAVVIDIVALKGMIVK